MDNEQRVEKRRPEDRIPGLRRSLDTTVAIGGRDLGEVQNSSRDDDPSGADAEREVWQCGSEWEGP